MPLTPYNGDLVRSATKGCLLLVAQDLTRHKLAVEVRRLDLKGE